MSALDQSGVDTLVARVLWERRAVALDVLQQSLAEARQSRATLARVLVERGLVPAGPMNQILSGALGVAAPARQFGAYVLRQRLGQGGMGVVWLAEHEQSGARVALKTLPATSDPDFQRRFLREGEAQARVEPHANVISVHAAGCEGGTLYLVLDYATGGDLAQRLEAEGALSARAAASIARDLARGLAHVHAAGVLHRDLKPANVLFDEEGRPRLVDFGLARLEGRTALTESGVVLGTPAYMAPEQATGDRGAMGPQTDVYGLGALLYALLTGAAPFQGPTIFSILDQVLTLPPQPPGADPALDVICLRCLEKDPASRYASASALAEALDAYLEGRAEPPPKLGRKVLGALALATLVTAGLGGVLHFGLRSRPATPSPGPTLSHLEQGIAAAQAEDWRSALVAFERARRESPESAQVLAWSGRALRQAGGREDEALSDLTLAFKGGEARDQSDWILTSWLERGREFQRRGYPKLAAQAWSSALLVAPRSPEATLGLGWALVRTGPFEPAVELATQEIQRNPRSLEAHLLRACAQRRIPAQVEAARADHDRALALATDEASRARALGQRARYFLGYLDSRPDGAEDGHEAMALSEPDFVSLTIDAAFSVKHGELGRAQETLEKLKRLAPASGYAEWARAQLDRARARSAPRHLRASLHESAQEHLRTGFRIDPWSPEINCELGLGAFNAGDYEASDFHLSRVVQVLPHDSRARRRRAWTRLRLGDRVTAFEDIEALTKTPKGRTDLFDSADLLDTIGAPARALELALQACRLESSPEGQARVVNYLLQLGRFAEADEAVRQIPSGVRRDASLERLNLARSPHQPPEEVVARAKAMATSAPAPAASLVRLALNSDPARHDWWLRAARLHLASQNLTEAAYSCYRALALKPKHLDSLELRARVLSSAGDLRAATLDLEAFLASAPPEDPRRPEIKARLAQVKLDEAAQEAKRKRSHSQRH